MARSFTEDEVQQLIAKAVAPLKARIAELEAENARLRKNSTTSSSFFVRPMCGCNCVGHT
jgi:hypothetical protein